MPRRSLAATHVPAVRESVGPAVPVPADVRSSAAGRPTHPFPSLPDELEPLGLLERGGMGEVWRAWEHGPGREVALKVALPSIAADPSLLARFDAEVQVMAHLDHPGVIPVYRQGRLADGRPWFTMRRVRGHTFADLLAAPRSGAGTAGLRTLLEIFERICETVAYAHDHGVVHRDLKPSNVMVGAFGEVLVLDWGIAHAGPGIGTAANPFRADPARAAQRAAGPTQVGDVLGTPAYMAPEQAAGAPAGPGADVWALGAMLHHALIGTLPASAAERGRPGPAAAASERLAHTLPRALLELCDAALSEDPADRPADARVLSEALHRWRDEAERQEEALRQVAALAPLTAELAEHRARAQSLTRDAQERLGRLAPWASEEECLPGWAMEADARAAEAEAAIIEARFEQGLAAALRVDPELSAAHDALADLGHRRLVASEEDGDAVAGARARALLEAHARGPRRALLGDDGQWGARLCVPGAAVVVERLVDRHGRLVANPVRLGDGADRVGDTIRGAVPSGSYRLRIVAEGFHALTIPLRVRRGEVVWAGASAGEEPAPVRLLALGSLGRDDVYVPAGPALVGGDGDAPDAVRRRTLSLDAFVMRRFVVTVAEWLDFLNDLGRRGEDVEPHVPRPRGAGGEVGPEVLRRNTDGTFLPGAGSDGIQLQSDWPITLISFHSAIRFAVWEAERTGLPWRLPDEWEWEKAARGVDGRLYPWGSRCVGAWACMNQSHAERPHRASVHAFPVDDSVYGVRGMGGNVRQWCLNAYSRWGPPDEVTRVEPGRFGGDETWRITRGGSWTSNAVFCRSAARFVVRPDATASVVGLRLVRTV